MTDQFPHPFTTLPPAEDEAAHVRGNDGAVSALDRLVQTSFETGAIEMRNKIMRLLLAEIKSTAFDSPFAGQLLRVANLVGALELPVTPKKDAAP